MHTGYNLVMFTKLYQEDKHIARHYVEDPIKDKPVGVFSEPIPVSVLEELIIDFYYINKTAFCEINGTMTPHVYVNEYRYRDYTAFPLKSFYSPKLRILWLRNISSTNTYGTLIPRQQIYDALFPISQDIDYFGAFGTTGGYDSLKNISNFKDLDTTGSKAIALSNEVLNQQTNILRAILNTNTYTAVNDNYYDCRFDPDNGIFYQIAPNYGIDVPI